MAAKDSPLKQFEIDPISNIELAGYNIAFTNIKYLIRDNDLKFHQFHPREYVLSCKCPLRLDPLFSL